MAPNSTASTPAASSQDAIDRSLQYIMLVLSTCDAFKPNYHTVATEAGICDANTAQKKFKKFVEQAGYSLVKGSVIGPSGDAATPPTTPMKKKETKAAQAKKKTPGSTSKKSKASQPNKKRKIEAGESEDEIVEATEKGESVD